MPDTNDTYGVIAAICAVAAFTLYEESSLELTPAALLLCAVFCVAGMVYPLFKRDGR